MQILVQHITELCRYHRSEY